MTYVRRQCLLHTNNMKRMPKTPKVGDRRTLRKLAGSRDKCKWGIGIQCVCVGGGGEYHVLHYGNMQGVETSASGRCTRTHAHTLHVHTPHPQMHKCTHAHTHGHTIHAHREREKQKNTHSTSLSARPHLKSTEEAKHRNACSRRWHWT